MYVQVHKTDLAAMCPELSTIVRSELDQKALVKLLLDPQISLTGKGGNKCWFATVVSVCVCVCVCVCVRTCTLTCAVHIPRPNCDASMVHHVGRAAITTNMH